MPGREERVVIEVGGMSCGHCVETVRKALADTAGVLAAEVNLERGEAGVQFDPTLTTVAQLMQAVKRTGFTARGFRKTPS